MDILNILFKNEKQASKKLLLFIGSPRTGSTLLGQIINYHPECLVANEFRLLDKIILKNQSENKTFLQLEKKAYQQFKSGLEMDQHYAKTLSRYQERWRSFSNLIDDTDIKKKEIKLIGEKKAGGNIEIYQKHQHKMHNFLLKQKQLYLLQIIRNPIDASLSLMKSHNVKPFKNAVDQIVSQTHAAYRLGTKEKFLYHHVYYEDLQSTPQKEILKVFDFLGLTVCESWLHTLAQVVAKKKLKPKDLKLYNITEKVVKEYNALPELGRYFKQ